MLESFSCSVGEKDIVEPVLLSLFSVLMLSMPSNVITIVTETELSNRSYYPGTLLTTGPLLQG